MNNYIRFIFSFFSLLLPLAIPSKTVEGKRIKCKMTSLNEVPSSGEKEWGKMCWKWKRKCVPFYMPSSDSNGTHWMALTMRRNSKWFFPFLNTLCAALSLLRCVCLLFPVRRFSIFTSIFILFFFHLFHRTSPLRAFYILKIARKVTTRQKKEMNRMKGSAAQHCTPRSNKSIFYSLINHSHKYTCTRRKNVQRLSATRWKEWRSKRRRRRKKGTIVKFYLFSVFHFVC